MVAVRKITFEPQSTSPVNFSFGVRISLGGDIVAQGSGAVSSTVPAGTEVVIFDFTGGGQGVGDLGAGFEPEADMFLGQVAPGGAPLLFRVRTRASGVITIPVSPGEERTVRLNQVAPVTVPDDPSIDPSQVPGGTVTVTPFPGTTTIPGGNGLQTTPATVNGGILGRVGLTGLLVVGALLFAFRPGGRKKAGR